MPSAIESDVFVKFGEDPYDVDPFTDLPNPLVEGDCTDDNHYYWCELRSCGFTLTVPDPAKPAESAGGAGAGAGGAGAGTEPQPSKPSWGKVSLKKRVDWASTRLFHRCCKAGKEKIEKVKADKSKQETEFLQVTVEICKTAGGEKFPFVIIYYRGVRVTKFSVSMSGPEPEETVEIEFDSYEFAYQPTDPETGKKSGKLKSTGNIVQDENPTDAHDGVASIIGALTVGGAAAAGAAAAAGVGAAPGVGAAAGGAGNSGSPAGLSSATEAAVAANFPGLSQGTGSGVFSN